MGASREALESFSRCLDWNELQDWTNSVFVVEFSFLSSLWPALGFSFGLVVVVAGYLLFAACLDTVCGLKVKVKVETQWERTRCLLMRVIKVIQQRRLKPRSRFLVLVWLEQNGSQKGRKTLVTVEPFSRGQSWPQESSGNTIDLVGSEWGQNREEKTRSQPKSVSI